MSCATLAKPASGAAALAQRLQRAEESRAPIRQIHLDSPAMCIDEAYAVQCEWTAMKLAAGQRRVGHKVGMTSRAKRLSVGIDEPDFGVLFDRMVFDNGSRISFDRFIEPRVEMELAFVLGRPLRGPHCSMFDVLSATDHVVAAIEIVDSRVQLTDSETGSGRTIVDLIADNASSAGMLLGTRLLRPCDLDLATVCGVLHRNGQIEETGVAAAVLNHPANSLAWLANKLEAHGESLRPGDVILSGAFTRAVPARRGDTFHATLGPLGAVSFQLV
jgi:2-oxo-hept-3-ene-1,7-dioate hydratase